MSSFDVGNHLPEALQHRSQVLFPTHLSCPMDGWERTLGTRLETPMSFRATEKILRTSKGRKREGALSPPSRVPRHAPPLNKI